MIDARIKTENEGRYLTVRGEGSGCHMEQKMIEELKSPHIITPRIKEYPDGVVYSYEITGMADLREYMEQVRMSESEITGIIIALACAADTLRDHLLGEENLILIDKYIYVDRYEKKLRFCALPESDPDTPSRFKELMRQMLLHADTEDPLALKLAVMLFKEANRKDLRLYDLSDILLLARAREKCITPAPESKAPKLTGSDTPSREHAAQRTPKLTAADERGHIEPPASGPGETLRSSYTIEDLDNIGIDEVMPEDFKLPEEIRRSLPDIKTMAKKIGISQAIMLMGLIVVWVLKGRALVIKVLPVYIILSLSLAVYLALGVLIKQE